MKQTTQNIRDEESWRRAKVHFAVVIASMLFLLAYLSQENTFHRMTRELLSLERERRDLVEERDRLAITVEHHRNPARIRTLAEERYGLTVPEAGRVQDVPIAGRTR